MTSHVNDVGFSVLRQARLASALQIWCFHLRGAGSDGSKSPSRLLVISRYLVPTASNTDTALRLDTNVSGETTQIPRQMTLDDYGLSSSLPSPMVDKSIDPPSTPRPAPHLGPARTLTTVVETYRRPKIINGEATTPSISESV